MQWKRASLKSLLPPKSYKFERSEKLAQTLINQNQLDGTTLSASIYSNLKINNQSQNELKDFQDLINKQIMIISQ